MNTFENKILSAAFRFRTNKFRRSIRDVITQPSNNNLERLTQSAENLIDFLGEDKYVITYVNDDEYTFAVDSRKIIDVYEKAYNGNYQPNIENQKGSDEGMNFYFTNDTFSQILDLGEEIEIELIESKDKGGAYFSQLHTTDLDLTKIQILSNKDTKDKYKKTCKDHCFIHAIKEAIKENGEDTNKNDPLRKLIIELSYIISSRAFKLDRRNSNGMKVDKILKRLEIKLVVTYHSDNFENKKPNVITYGMDSKEKTKINMIRFRDHFMINSSLTVQKGDNLFDSKRKCTKKTAWILKKLVQENRLVYSRFNVNRIKFVNEDDLMETDLIENQKEIEHKIRNNKMLRYFADFESIVYNEENHMPFMLGVVGDSIGFKSFEAGNIQDLENCSIMTKMLDYLIKSMKKEEIEDKKIAKKIYFHNLKYDFTLMKLNKYITISKEISKDGQIYSVQIFYNKIEFTLIDSYKMISHPLSKFKSMFGLKEGKLEFSFYNMFTRENFTKQTFKEEEFEKILMIQENKSGEEIKEIMESDTIKNHSTPFGIHFKSIYRDYLMNDCITLRDGMNKFRDHIEEVFKLDSYQYLTISSLAYNYMLSQGCLDGTYEVGSNLQEYIMKSVTGGRVCLKDNKKRIVRSVKEGDIPEDAIADFDGVSLYPSAIMRTTIPKGKAELIDKTSDLSKYSQYIVTIKLKLNKYQQIPMISTKIDDIREWTNEINDYITIDKVTLEDLIEFQGAEILDIKYGVGWDKENGTNDKLKEVIDHIFQARLMAKSEGNTGRSESIKLIMNSIYGKTMLRDSESKIHYIRGKEKLEQYILMNYNSFVSATPTRKISENEDPKYILYRVLCKKSFIGKFNSAHIGCFILSMSKRIMNEVLNTANESNLSIEYTDTDSIHMQYKDVDTLAKNYKEKYQRELVGKQLGQFHIDFTSNKLDPKTIHSKLFIGLGKKCYLDVLTDKNKKIEEYHIRFKGASKENIINFCRENNITVIDFYIKLYEGESIELDICSGKIRFGFTQQTVFTKNQMIKKFKF